MKSKPIQLSPKKGGNGYISSYSVNLGSREVKACGFLSEEGRPLPLEKYIDEENQQIIIRLAEKTPAPETESVSLCQKPGE